jgi:hypothetical protein
MTMAATKQKMTAVDELVVAQRAYAAALARMTAVIASEHYAGREALAHRMIANVKLSAEEIIDTLSVAKKASPASQAR